MSRRPAPLILVSNRGPVTFGHGPDGGVQQTRGGGGLVTALLGLVEHTPALWVSAAISEGDERMAADAGGGSFPIDDFGLEHYGLDPSGRVPVPRDGRLRIAEGLWAIGDVAGPELHTHQGHYQGELAVRMALGDGVEPDYRALPRATYTDPEAAFVGRSLEQAREAGIDAFEAVADFATSSKDYTVEATGGHVTLVVDRASRQLVGAAMACPDASAAIHECVVAIRARVTVDVLADTIHAFPSTSRIFNGLFADAVRELSKS